MENWILVNRPTISQTTLSQTSLLETTLPQILRLTLFLICMPISIIAAQANTENTQADEPENTKTKYQDIRLYRVNKDGIETRFWFTRGKGRKTGCHNIPKRSRLHRAVQYGYKVCRVYGKKNCAAETDIMFKREKEAESTIDLLQGYSWFSINEHKKGPKIKSWSCTH